MADTTFTILGTTGSGKTCYLTGLYYKMVRGMRGYSITTDDDSDYKLRNDYKKMQDTSLQSDRFPAGTDNLSEYEFQLEYGYNPILSFKWVDYPGGALASKNEGDYEQYQTIKNSIKNSSCLFICVDGSLLVGDDTDEKIDNIKDECSAIINPFFSEYLKENEMLPPTAILITKYDKCKDDTSSEELCTIMEECFSPFFIKSNNTNVKRLITIIPVSLGKDLDDSSYMSKLRPINIHLPIFMGIWFAQQDLIKKYLKDIKNINKKITSDGLKKSSEEDSFFLWRDSKLINELKDKIDNNEKEKTKIKNLIESMKNNNNKLLEELNKINIIYLNGDKQDNFSKIVEDISSEKTMMISH